MYLDQIVTRTQERITEIKRTVSFGTWLTQAEALGQETGFPFERALSGPDLSFICEVKRASPSRGLIAPDFPYRSIACDYAEAGASAISCLTEPFFFQGADQHLSEIARMVPLPVLRKDFHIDEMMICQAKLLSASAVLLICAILEPGKLRSLIDLAHHLGLSALVETHSEEEIEKALSAGARIIGVNNRDLFTFQVDPETSVRLRNHVPDSVLFVAESGIKTPQDVARMRDIGAHAVLIGEALMQSEDKKAALKRLREASI